MLTNNVEQTFLSPSLLLPRRLSQPSAYSFDSTHRRVTPMPTHSGGMQCATTPTSNVDVLYSGKSVTTKDNVSTAKIRNTGFPTNVLLAAANATKKPTPLSSFEPSRSRFPHDTLFFPAVVYRMIEDVSKKMDFTLMHWNDAGDKFFIDQNNPILGPTLKRFFNRTFCAARG